METLYRKVAVGERMPPPMTDILIKYRWSDYFEPYHYFDDLHCKDEMLNEVTHWLEEIPDNSHQIEKLEADKVLYRKVSVSERLPENKGYFDTDVGNIYFLKKTWQPSKFTRKAKVNRYHEDYFEEPEYWLEEIPDPTAKLKADKAELLEALEKLRNHYGLFPENRIEIESLIQKMKKCQENKPR